LIWFAIFSEGALIFRNIRWVVCQISIYDFGLFEGKVNNIGEYFTKIVKFPLKLQPKNILRNQENQTSLVASLIILFTPLPTAKIKYH